MLLLSGLLLFPSLLGFYADRYVVINGPEYVSVSKHYFMRALHDRECLKHDEQSYPKYHVVVHRCYI